MWGHGFSLKECLHHGEGGSGSVEGCQVACTADGCEGDLAMVPDDGETALDLRGGG